MIHLQHSEVPLLRRTLSMLPFEDIPERYAAPNLHPRVPPQSQLPVVPQSHIAAPTSVSRSQANIYEFPAKAYVIYDPLPNDILLGRGKPIQQRPGNIRYREMVEKQMDRYDEGDRGAKYTVTASIAYLLKEEGGQFLKEIDDGIWVEVDEATARLKIGRSQRKVLQATHKKGKKHRMVNTEDLAEDATTYLSSTSVVDAMCFCFPTTQSMTRLPLLTNMFAPT
jgi:uncharacterized protein YuzE